MNKMNSGFCTGMLLLGTLISGSGQELRKPTPPPPPAAGPRPAVLSPLVAAAPAPAAVPAPGPTAPSVVPVQRIPPQAYSAPSYPPPQAPAPSMGPLTALKFDAERKEYSSKAGEMQAPFTFFLTNVSSSEVSISAVRTSCGCTVAKLPSTPWVIPPGQGGPIDVSVNLAGKSGAITKSVTVESSAGVKSLLVTVNIGAGPGGVTPLANGAPHPMMNDAERLKNMQAALADRQVLFKNQDCAKCHADPAKGHVDGRQIYAAVCATCHESPIRAAMVPDLKTLKHPTDADYWRNWITFGRAGSMMPAFAQAEGGPLSDSQIEALVNYMLQAFPGSRLPRALQNRQSASVVSPAVAVPPVAAAGSTTSK